jgi:hypothetical protein
MLLPIVALGQQDLIEFGSVEQAADFGWLASTDVPLRVADGAAVGAFALFVPGIADKPYQGIRLRHDLDLTDAQPTDTLVFHVKQNAATSVCVNLRVGEGHVYRYAPVTRGQWSRVELDLDLANWENPAGSTWGVVQTMSIYTKGFDTADEYLAIDGLSATVHGLPLQLHRAADDPQSWDFPQQTDAAWLIGDANTAWAIDKTTGRVIGAWNVRTRQRYVNGIEGRYHMEDAASFTTVNETADRIVDATFDPSSQQLVLQCANEKLPGVAIEKRYALEDNRLARRIAFVAAERDDRFITYNCEVAFTPPYRNDGYYMGSGFLGPLVPVPDIAATKRVTEYRSTPKCMILHQPKAGYSFAHVRTHVDDYFVWPFFSGAIAGYVERANALSYTPTGWEISLGTSPLRAGRETSYRELFTIFRGDWYDFFDRQYYSLKSVRTALDEIPPAPKWCNDIVIFTGMSSFDHVKRLVEMSDEGQVVVLISQWGSWADYYVDEGLVGQDGGFMNGPELKDMIDRLKALSPRVKVCLYNLVWSATYESRIFAKHPEWFRQRNKEGQPLNFFPGCAPNYASLISDRGCYDELLRQCDLQFEYLGVDMIYLDIGVAVNMVDWETGRFNRDDLSYQFFLDLKRIAARHGPDKAIFYNGRGNPYADLNFTEARGQLRAGYWRQFAGMALGMETFSNYRPDSRIIPLYWTPPLARDYVNRVLALGWVPSLTYGSPIENRPFAEAAYEIGNARSVRADYTPDWKNDPDTLLESYVVQRPDDRGRLLSLIDHADESRTVTVTINLADFDFDRDGMVYVIDHAVASAADFKGTVTTPIARRDYRDSGWRHDIVTRRQLLYAGPYADELTLSIDMRPLLLRQLYITDEPMAVFSHSDLPANYLFARSRGVSVRSTIDERRMTATVVCDQDSAEVIALPPDGWSIVSAQVDGKAAELDWTYECGRLCPVIAVSRGEHTVELRGGDAVDAITVGDFAATWRGLRIVLSVPGLATVERDGRIIASGMGDSLPIAPVRTGGDCTVTLRAVERQGRMVPVDASPVTVSLSDASLGMPPVKPKHAEQTLHVTDVNRMIDGVFVLRAAAFDTGGAMHGFQPDLPGLTASVDPDNLTMEAGTTRKVIGYMGAAAAGLELKGVRRVQVRLDNSFYGNFSLRARGRHEPMYHGSSREFAGIVVDYNTAEGYTKRVFLSVGVLHRTCTSPYPAYGRNAHADTMLEFGDLVNQGPSKVFAFDIAEYAPDGWRGEVWLSVATDWVASDRRLTMKILAVNDAVTAPLLRATDPNAVRELFDQPKQVDVPRAPQAPIIDGAPDDEMWQAAAVIDRFFLAGGEAFPQNETKVKLFYDDTHLYVAYLLRDAERDKPMFKYGPLWHDDEVELWIDIDGDRKSYHQVIVNGSGDSLQFQADGVRDFGATAAAHIDGNGAWYVEIAVPFAGLGVDAPKPGDTWQINFARSRPPGDTVGEELITWGPLEHGFNELNHFGTATFR